MSNTGEVVSYLSDYLATAYSGLIKEYILFQIASILLFFTLPIAILRFSSKIRDGAYLFRPATSKVGHLLYMAYLLFVGIWALFARSTETVKYGRVVAVCVLFLIIITVIQLFRWRASGIALAFISLISFCIFKNWIWISLCLMDDLNTFTLLERNMLYSFHDYLLFSGMLLSAFTVALAVFVSVYYYKRRYLFKIIQTPKCRNCGNYILRGQNFCTYCGEELHENPIKNGLPEPADRVSYCGRCGKILTRGVCANCEGKEKAVKKVIEETAKDVTGGGIPDTIKNAIIFALLVAVMFVPLILNHNFERGSSKVENAYVETWNEFFTDASVAADDTWYQKFEDTADALFIFDTKWVNVNPRTIKFYELPYFLDYTKATYSQMESVQNSKDIVKTVRGVLKDYAGNGKSDDNIVWSEVDDAIKESAVYTSLLHDLEVAGGDPSGYAVEADEQGELTPIKIALYINSDEFNASVEAQSRALPKKLVDYGNINVLLHTAIDGIRFWASRLGNLNVVSIVLIIWAVLMLLLILNTFDEKLEWNNALARILKAERGLDSFETDGTVLYRLGKLFLYLLYIIRVMIAQLILLAVGVLLFAASLVSLYRPANIRAVFAWAYHGVFDNAKNKTHTETDSDYIKRDKLVTAAAYAIGVAIPLLLILGSYGVSRMIGGKISRQSELEEMAIAVTMKYSVNLSQMLSDISFSGEIKDKDSVIELIDQQLESDQRILDYTDAYTRDAQLLDGLKAMSKDDAEILEDIREMIENDEIPSQEMIRNYASIRGQNYTWILEDMFGADIENLGNTVFE